MKVLYGKVGAISRIDANELAAKANLKLSDIVDVAYVVKSKKTDEDNVAVVFKTLGSGIVLSDDTDQKYVVSFAETDYDTGGLEVSRRYYRTYGVKTSGDTKYREVTLKDELLEVTQDLIRG